MRILLVEDDKDLSQFIKDGLVREGFSVDLVRTGPDAIDFASAGAYSIILLDVMMPGGMDGYKILKTLRSRGNTAAILMVTARGQENDRLTGLNNGADDYIIKPFLLSELIARVRAVLRRTGSTVKGMGSTILKAGRLSLDPLKREVKKSGKNIFLTKREFDLLEYFMRRPGQVISQTILSQHLSQNDFSSASNIVEVHIKNLREKIDVAAKKSCIRTVRGCGYALDV